jgi:Mn-dependent DtxR family transcriptional regulator
LDKLGKGLISKDSILPHNRKIKNFMGATILTLEDLQDFKVEILQEIRNLLKDKTKIQKSKWIKSKELGEMLGVSPGTIMNLRIKGVLPYTKIGGVMFYEYNEILKIIEKNKIHNVFKS